jgi:2-polyprenyl-3-methyl-5-hydroxy-6-metoxy-1,4-benzoquinol methylase
MGAGAGALTVVDRRLRDMRIAQARPFIMEGAALLDIGCGDGTLVRRLSGHLRRAVGIEPTLDQPQRGAGYELLPGSLPGDLGVTGPFDVITMLAVVEHLPETVQARLADVCAGLLRPGGRVVLTVPSERVDPILDWLVRLRLVAGIGVEEHHGFDPAQTVELFPAPRYRLAWHAQFELGLNNLFVFELAAS